MIRSVFTNKLSKFRIDQVENAEITFSASIRSILIVFTALVNPATTVTSLFRMPNFFAINSITALLALPFSGGADTDIFAR